MTQQQPFDFMPLKYGLDLISKEKFENYIPDSFDLEKGEITKLCPKIYTTRTHKLSGEYYVVRGSRFKAVPVEPRIEFKVEKNFELNLENALFFMDYLDDSSSVDGWYGVDSLFQFIASYRSFGYQRFSEFDLGIKAVGFYDLVDELLKLNPKKTVKDKFYINYLEPIKTKEG